MGEREYDDGSVSTETLILAAQKRFQEDGAQIIALKAEVERLRGLLLEAIDMSALIFLDGGESTTVNEFNALSDRVRAALADKGGAR